MKEDKILYKEFLDGNKKSFEELILKYKNNLIFFITRYVKNIETAEDIFQDIAVYILENKDYYNFDYSFKTYIYMIAKSKTIDFIKKQKNIDSIDDSNFELEDTKLLEEIILSKDRQKKIQNVMKKMLPEYQLVIYLTQIEGLSYKDTALIMNKKESQIKTLSFNARKRLRQLMLDEKVVELKGNKLIKLLTWFLIVSIITTGVTFAAIKIYKKIRGQANMTPIYTSNISTIDSNKVWIGTFNLVWNDFMNEVIGQEIEFEDGYSELANELNKQSFTSNELSENSYFKIHGETSEELKNKIQREIKEKFNEDSQIIDKINWKNPEAYILYAILKKEYNFFEKFPLLEDGTFENSKEKVKYFGLKPNRSQKASINVNVLFYNSKDDFAIRLNTIEGEEIYLYKTIEKNKTFEEFYFEMLDKENSYTGNKSWQKNDILKIPFIQVNEEINYDELCGRIIKGTDKCISQALQTINFELNNVGGFVKSEAIMEVSKSVSPKAEREFLFDSDFIIYLKEKNKKQPYFALNVDNIDVLITAEN